MMKSHQQILKELDVAYDLAVKEGNYEKAFESCDYIIKENPTLPFGLRKRAAIFAKKRDFPKAIYDISEAIKIEPNEPEYYIFRGWWNFEQHLFDESIVDQTKAIDLGNEQMYDAYDEIAYFFRGMAFVKSKRFIEALADFENVRDDFLIYTIEGKQSKAELIKTAKRGLR